VRIITLVENNRGDDSLMDIEHGLCLYIEIGDKKYLFDTGASDLLIRNAMKKDIDLSLVDAVFISHGHYDHGGGLLSFLSINSKAKIYLSKYALNEFAVFVNNQKERDIGLDPSLKNNNRFIAIDDILMIDEQVSIFSNVQGRRFFPTSNEVLYQKDEHGKWVLDSFNHEINVVLQEEKQVVLLAGCAHNGIINIIDHLKSNLKLTPTVVIGGFHLSNPTLKTNEDPIRVTQLAAELLAGRAKYYTCHCTGLPSYVVLKQAMNQHIEYLATGDELVL